MTAKAAAPIAVLPAARPSKPSDRFTAFTTPTRTKIVERNVDHRGQGDGPLPKGDKQVSTYPGVGVEGDQGGYAELGD